MKTKNRILNEALKQFNEVGVEVVTTRHIAKTLEISQGNLHYHFPNKDLIINKLYDNFIENIIDASRNVTDTIFKKEDVLLSMKENFSIMFTYRFLFRDNKIVWRRIPELKIKMLQLFALKKKEIKEIISIYIEQDIFRKDISDKQIEFLANQFIFTISNWLNASEYLEVKSKEIQYFTYFTFRHWLPYLKDNKMEQWEALL